MRRFKLSLFVLLVLGPFASFVQAAETQDYAVLIISRERLEESTSCEIGIYLQGQLTTRLFSEDSRSFNLPAGPVSIRLSPLPDNGHACQVGITEPLTSTIELKAGEIRKYRIGMNQSGLYLKPAELNY